MYSQNNAPGFTSLVLAWYQQYKRDLPWRHTRHPYPIWLSEVILQQTRVKQGLPYYEKFIAAFPDVFALAQASEEEVLRHWQGLGYYSRARNMHKAAKTIVELHRGVFPNTYAGLLRLKGVGKYTAAAIASFAFDEPVAVLDGNVFRVLARYFGVDDNIARPAGVKKFEQLAQSLLPESRAGEYNQAIMEFGALQCSPQKPNCLYCPLQENCYAYQYGKTGSLPVKQKSKSLRTRYFDYLVLFQDQKLALRARPGGDIWQGLYEFYLIEQAHSFEDGQLPPVPAPGQVMGLAGPVYKHVLTHQQLFVRFWRINWPKLVNLPANGMKFYTYEEIQRLPKPILIQKYLENHFF
ncbi:MAG: A/G-specific adenine glycosylase [Microscillaceae bacterium]